MVYVLKIVIEILTTVVCLVAATSPPAAVLHCINVKAPECSNRHSDYACICSHVDAILYCLAIHSPYGNYLEARDHFLGTCVERIPELMDNPKFNLDLPKRKTKRFVSSVSSTTNSNFFNPTNYPKDNKDNDKKNECIEKIGESNKKKISNDICIDENCHCQCYCTCEPESDNDKRNEDNTKDHHIDEHYNDDDDDSDNDIADYNKNKPCNNDESDCQDEEDKDKKNMEFENNLNSIIDDGLYNYEESFDEEEKEEGEEKREKTGEEGEEGEEGEKEGEKKGEEPEEDKEELHNIIDLDDFGSTDQNQSSIIDSENLKETDKKEHSNKDICKDLESIKEDDSSNFCYCYCDCETKEIVSNLSSIKPKSSAMSDGKLVNFEKYKQNERFSTPFIRNQEKNFWEEETISRDALLAKVKKELHSDKNTQKSMIEIENAIDFQFATPKVVFPELVKRDFTVESAARKRRSDRKFVDEYHSQIRLGSSFHRKEKISKPFANYKNN